MPAAENEGDARQLLVYGSYGYSGRLIVQTLLEQGLRPVLAGRDEHRLKRQAANLNLRFRCFNLTTVSAAAEQLADIRALLNCAGPFTHTAKTLAGACLSRSVHYLDITGEIAVFEALAALDAPAQKAGVVLLPGVGFDVVPSDCLAAHVKSRLPDADKLCLAFTAGGGFSRGTLNTMIEGLGQPGAIRRAGRITAVPPAYRTRQIDFGYGPRLTVTIPWGDVASAWYSTRIPDIEVYTRISGGGLRFLVATRYLGWLLRLPAIQGWLKQRVRTRRSGPAEQIRATTRSVLWAEARNANGRCVHSRLRTPNGYTLTAVTAAAAARKILAGEVWPGFHTPALAFGKDFVLSLPDVSREDID